MRRHPPYLIWPWDGIKLLLTFAALAAVFAGILSQRPLPARSRLAATAIPSPLPAVATRPSATPTRLPQPATPTALPTKSPTPSPTATLTPTPTPAATVAPATPTPAGTILAITWPEPGTTLRTPRPIFRGMGRPGDAITILDGETELGMTSVDAGGRWRFVVAEPLAAGEHIIRAVVKDEQGRVVLESAPLKVAIAP
jgi:hypothetical protein